jgi:hypothetical protein
MYILGLGNRLDSGQIFSVDRRILVPTFVDESVSIGQRGGKPITVNLRFLDQCR